LLDGPGGDLAASPNAELVGDVLDVVHRRALADDQRRRGVAGGQSARARSEATSRSRGVSRPLANIIE
jgi:hypothetical protein